MCAAGSIVLAYTIASVSIKAILKLIRLVYANASVYASSSSHTVNILVINLSITVINPSHMSLKTFVCPRIFHHKLSQIASEESSGIYRIRVVGT